MNEQVNINQQVVAHWFENSYRCSECNTEWTDEWSCMCNDRCPECDVETEPKTSLDLSRQLTPEDYFGAARLLAGSPDATLADITAEDARDYAEAVLEGGEYRFESSRQA